MPEPPLKRAKHEKEDRNLKLDFAGASTPAEILQKQLHAVRSLLDVYTVEHHAVLEDLYACHASRAQAGQPALQQPHAAAPVHPGPPSTSPPRTGPEEPNQQNAPLRLRHLLPHPRTAPQQEKKHGDSPIVLAPGFGVLASEQQQQPHQTPQHPLNQQQSESAKQQEPPKQQQQHVQASTPTQQQGPPPLLPHSAKAGCKAESQNSGAVSLDAWVGARIASTPQSVSHPPAQPDGASPQSLPLGARADTAAPIHRLSVVKESATEGEQHADDVVQQQQQQQKLSSKAEGAGGSVGQAALPKEGAASGRPVSMDVDQGVGSAAVPGQPDAGVGKDEGVSARAGMAPAGPAAMDVDQGVGSAAVSGQPHLGLQQQQQQQLQRQQHEGEQRDCGGAEVKVEDMRASGMCTCQQQQQQQQGAEHEVHSSPARASLAGGASLAGEAEQASGAPSGAAPAGESPAGGAAPAGESPAEGAAPAGMSLAGTLAPDHGVITPASATQAHKGGGGSGGGGLDSTPAAPALAAAAGGTHATGETAPPVPQPTCTPPPNLLGQYGDDVLGFGGVHHQRGVFTFREAKSLVRDLLRSAGTSQQQHSVGANESARPAAAAAAAPQGAAPFPSQSATPTAAPPPSQGAAAGTVPVVACAEELGAWRARFVDALPQIAQLEAAASATTEQELDVEGALACLAGRTGRYLIKRTTVLLGRSTEAKGEVDVDLSCEGSCKVSRRQAYLTLEADGCFKITNAGQRLIVVDGKQVQQFESAEVGHLSLIEVGDVPLLLLVNKAAVQRVQRRTQRAAA